MRIVHELAHQQVRELVIAVLKAQLVDVEQVTAAGDSIFNGHDLPPLAIWPPRPVLQRRVADIDLHPVGFLLAFVEPVTGPEWVSLMGHRGWRAEVCLFPLLVHRHARRHLAERLETVNPEVFIQIGVAVVALRCLGVGTQEVKLSAVGRR